MPKFFPILELKGNPYDIGLAHGRALAGAIKANLDLYFAMVRELAGLEPNKCLSLAGNFLQVMKEDAAALLEEMEGIAQGADVSLEEIMFLNARSELMSMRPEASGLRGECTAIGLAAERTTGGRPILAQNWDWHEHMLETAAVFMIEPSQRPKALYLAEAGQVAKIGINSCGVAVLLNILFSEETMRSGLPVHVLLRMVLSTENAAEAEALIKNARRAGASHFLIGDDEGRIKGLELAPTEIGEIELENGVVFHTNHYCIPELAEKDRGRLLFTDTIARFDRAGALLSSRKKWDTRSLTELFSNHEDGPLSICRHRQSSDQEFQRMVTVASCIIDVTERKMLISHGQPCRASYQEVTLN
ncbi:MAG: hypothetical protein JSV31_16445 [Desulfobacterales bacterium]|nr:MAG: hypothetical protein JSV31_16445 [Desulfobacterales bacterium]